MILLKGTLIPSIVFFVYAKYYIQISNMSRGNSKAINTEQIQQFLAAFHSDDNQRNHYMIATQMVVNIKTLISSGSQNDYKIAYR